MNKKKNKEELTEEEKIRQDENQKNADPASEKADNKGKQPGNTDKKSSSAKKKKKRKPGEIISDLEKALALSEEKNLRLRAEFDNFRKRSAKDMSAARIYGEIDAIIPILQVFDHFNMAMQAVESTGNIESMKEGLIMILKEFQKAFEEIGIEKIDASAKEFDPELHEAVAHESSDEAEEGIVIKQWSSGYKLGQRVLRPATVVVSSGQTENESDKESESSVENEENKNENE